jgi:hypothetical protein
VSPVAVKRRFGPPPAGITVVVLWMLKALLVVAKSRRGRKLLVAGGLGAAELARSERARNLYAQARSATQGIRRR